MLARRTAARTIAVVTVAAALLLLLTGMALAAPLHAAADDPPTYPGPEIGSGYNFWTNDWATNSFSTRRASVEYVGQHVEIYLDNQAELSNYTIGQLGEAFDTVIFPTLTNAYGAAPSVGPDEDPRIVILIYNFNDPDNDVDSVFCPWDMDPDRALYSSFQAYSNRKNMIYLNVDTLQNETDSAPALAAHEFSHLLVYYHDVMLDTSPDVGPESHWVDEGFATYGEHLCGYDQRVYGQALAFMHDPDFSLTSWQGLRQNYGASYLFMRYLAVREGSDFIRALAQQPLDGAEGIDVTLAAVGSPDTFVSLFDDWVLTGFLEGRVPQLPGYSYDGLSVFVDEDSPSGTPPFLRTSDVADYGARYVDFPAALPSKVFQVVVDGRDGAPLQAALISWDSQGTISPLIERFDLSNAVTGGKVDSPLGYDRHTLIVWARDGIGSPASYSFAYSGTTDPPGGIQFLDMGGDDPFYKYVGLLLDRGAISGSQVPSGSGLWFFKGENTVTRQQFAKIVMEATEEHSEGIDNQDNPSFTDVPPVWDASGYPYDYIEEAAEEGSVTGYANGQFHPNSSITRAQLVLMITRAAKSVGERLPEYTGDEKHFADVSVSFPYYEEIMAAWKAGIIDGSQASNGKWYFYPYGSASRNHVAKITAQFLAYLAAP